MMMMIVVVIEWLAYTHSLFFSAPNLALCQFYSVPSQTFDFSMITLKHSLSDCVNIRGEIVC